MDKGFFIVGDVHGCFHTFRKLLQEHWNKDTELLIQVGDLINKGHHPAKVVKYARELEREHQAVFLLGNHEYQAIKHFEKYNESWLQNYMTKTMKDYEKQDFDFQYDVKWFKTLPLQWENDHIFVSHAGICEHPEAYNPDSNYGILWNRLAIRNLGKLQVLGHTPQRDMQPYWNKEKNYCIVDTGAFMGWGLSAARVTKKGVITDLITELTDERDFY